MLHLATNVSTNALLSERSVLEQEHRQHEIHGRSSDLSDDEEGPEEPNWYYWQKKSPNDEEEESYETTVNLLTKSYHWSHWTGSKVFEGLEFSGEVLANFFGLTRSKYQWVLDYKEREVSEKLQQKLENHQRRHLQLQALLEAEQAKLKALEIGEYE